MCLSGEFESPQESVKRADITPFIRGEIFLIRFGP